MTSFVTQCPHCQTSFRVTSAQLSAAHGVVRCGACMAVFNAARYLHATEPTKLPLPSASPSLPESPQHLLQPAPVKPPKADESTLWIHDDLDLDSLDLDEELAKLERQERELSREFQALQSNSTSTSAPRHAPAVPHDESWAERLLTAETTRPAPPPRVPQDNVVASPTGLHFTVVNDDRPAATPPFATSDAPLTDHLDPMREPARIEPAIDSSEPQDEPSPPIMVHAPEADQPDSERQRGDHGLFELDDEPLQLDWQQAQRRPWGRWLGWGLLSLLALLTLAGQYVYFNFDELSRQDEYRPWLARVCPSLGCTLPPKVDISQIRSSNLVVRSHPEFTGALVVDAIIYNRASFAQPFPLLEIRFDDINGQTLARRTFKPGEYLSGELAGQQEMPSQIPIHIALDILDPGAKAVNYSLAFLSPE